MNNFKVLLNKEFVQMLREYKVIWLPLVFILLGITQPLTTYYLPSILEAVGGAQGIIIDPSMMAQSGAEVLASTLGSQFDQLGIMIIVVSLLGIIQTDKANGMLSFILTRPVTVASYISGKIISNYLLIGCSVTAGYLLSYVYANVLFTTVNGIDMFMALMFYLLWVLFIVTFTTLISTVFNSQGIVALISILVLIVSRIIVGLSPVIDFINPASMSSNAIEMLATGSMNSDTIWNVLVTLGWIGLTIIATNYWISNKKYSSE